jgi:NAD-dependent SIR2 family protein deacetylase
MTPVKNEDNNLIDFLTLLNNKLDILNNQSNKNKFLIEKFENMNNEIKNISSNIDEKELKCNTKINPYIIMITLYVVIIILYLVIN